MEEMFSLFGRKIKLRLVGLSPNDMVKTYLIVLKYMPKAKVPTLSVTPSNLIPACRGCNMDKKTDMILDPDATPVHLYYDRLPEESLLHVRIGDNLEITYFVSCLEGWGKSLR